MYKIYLKQAWALIRQERLFSSVYIVGTGLAISLVMVLSIVFYVKMASIYPEMDRDRLLTVKSAALKDEKGSTSSGPVSPRFVEECLRDVPGLEALALCCDDATSAFVQPAGSPVQVPVMKMGVNDGFWKVFSFRFLEGKPFTEADFRSGMPVAVIARSLAKRLYGDGSAVGQALSLDFTSFRVVGVVDDVSYLMDRVFSQVWYPYTQAPDFEERVRYSEARMPGLGPLKVYMLVKDKAEIGKAREAVADNVRRFNQSLDVDGKREFSLLGQPDRHWESIFRYWSNVEPDIVGDLSRYGMIFLLLLLVPAVSLSGMADSRMERRLGELGVRRAFGAPKGALIGQVLMENFLYTLLGGLVGLLFSFLLVTFASSWVFKIGKGFSDAAPDGVDVSLSMGMLFNPWVFLIALCVCFLLNLMSALWPAWRASRRPIVDSLNA